MRAPTERHHLLMGGDLEQPVPIKRAIGVLDENFEKIIFARGECFLAAVARIDKDALLEVENPPAQAHARPIGLRTACSTPQHAFYPGQELARIERLADIVVGTVLKSHDTVNRIGSVTMIIPSRPLRSHNHRASANPSSPGSPTSNKTSAGSSRSTSLRSAGPPSTPVTRKFCLPRYSTSNWRWAASSSTTTMCGR